MRLTQEELDVAWAAARIRMAARGLRLHKGGAETLGIKTRSLVFGATLLKGQDLAAILDTMPDVFAEAWGSLYGISVVITRAPRVDSFVSRGERRTRFAFRAAALEVEEKCLGSSKETT